MIANDYERRFLDGLRDVLLTPPIVGASRSPESTLDEGAIFLSGKPAFHEITALEAGSEPHVVILFRVGPSWEMLFGWALPFMSCLEDWDHDPDRPIDEHPEIAASMCAIEFGEDIAARLSTTNLGTEGVMWLTNRSLPSSPRP